MAKKIIVEVEDEQALEKIMKSLEKIGVKARIKPDPGEVRKRILERWRKTGRRAKPGDLINESLEEEFE